MSTILLLKLFDFASGGRFFFKTDVACNKTRNFLIRLQGQLSKEIFFFVRRFPAHCFKLSLLKDNCNSKVCYCLNTSGLANVSRNLNRRIGFFVFYISCNAR
jgi:hypothetical protein